MKIMGVKYGQRPYHTILLLEFFCHNWHGDVFSLAASSQPGKWWPQEEEDKEDREWTGSGRSSGRTRISLPGHGWGGHAHTFGRGGEG